MTTRITLDPERKKQFIAEIRAWFDENLDEVEVGDLRATLLLDFFWKTVGPTLYNQGVRDAAAHLQEKTQDLEGELFEPEFEA